jgi:hypothetical protein
MIQLTLANGKNVEVSQEEVNEFITQILIQNPDWLQSGLLTEEEWMRYLKNEGSLDDLKKVARYILIYEENLAFFGYLFDKTDGEPERTKEFNMPVVKKLRELYQKMSDGSRPVTDISQDVHEMENLCMETGADPL